VRTSSQAVQTDNYNFAAVILLFPRCSFRCVSENTEQ
jgi:hypothetical protein